MTMKDNNKDRKTVLVVGGGGRCHAIVEAFSRSERVGKIYCAPGNAGIAELAECVGISVTDTGALARFAESHGVDLTVPGPEAALAAGIADVFAEKGLAIVGPSKSATRIESSKEFAKQLMKKYGIPTGKYVSFTDYQEALGYVRSHSVPTVIKYDGLAAGKGVVVAMTHREAESALSDMLLDRTFGDGKVIIEEYLEGPEFSFMCLVNGRRVYPMAIAQDHKRVFDGDKGPNTGGMGAYSPVPFISEEIRRRCLEEIMQKTADAMADEGVPFVGVLYGGLILTEEGPKVIEFNARFGDPETEVVLPRLKSDMYSLFEAVAEGRDFDTEWSDDACLGMVLASKGYPGSYKKGAEIRFDREPGGKMYHMGTKLSDGRLVTDGGRVMMVVEKAGSLAEAREKALVDIAGIECEELFYRKDIGKAAIS